MRKLKTSASRARAVHAGDPSAVVTLARVWRVHTQCCGIPADVPLRPFVMEHSARGALPTLQEKAAGVDPQRRLGQRYGVLDGGRLMDSLYDPQVTRIQPPQRSRRPRSRSSAWPTPPSCTPPADCSPTGGRRSPKPPA